LAYKPFETGGFIGPAVWCPHVLGRGWGVPPGSEGDSRLATALIPRGFPGALGVIIHV